MADSNYPTTLPITLSPTFDPGKDTGFWPAEISGKPSGFEFYTLGRAEWEPLPNVGNPRRWMSAAQFSTHSDVTGFAVSVMTAVALAKSCDGAIYDPTQAKLYKNQEMDEFLKQTMLFAMLPSRSG